MTVKQAAQVLDVLKFFAEFQRPATLSEVADHFGWPRSSTFNLLTTLAEKGCLFEPRPRAGYYPTSVFGEMVERIAAGQPTPTGIHTVLEELAGTSGETAVLAAQAGMNVVFLDSVESAEAVRYTAPKGKVVPLLASAPGRALLSQRTPADRTAILRKAEFKAFTPHTLMSAEAIEKDIKESVARGWFKGRQENSLGLSAVAFPIELHARNYAIVVAGPFQRMEHELERIARESKKVIERSLKAAE